MIDMSNHDTKEQMSMTKYPNIEVKLTGSDGNAFAIIGRVKTALADGGASYEQVNKFMDEATSGDYNNVLATAMRWVSVA